MSISENDVKEYEDRYRKLIFDKVEEIISLQSKIITHIGKIGECVDIDASLPNIGITFNNKINELSQIFKKAGISMFSEPVEKQNMVTSNFVGDAIIEDIISQLSESVQKLYEYSASIKKVKKVKALENFGPIKSLFFKIRSLFIPNASSKFSSKSDDKMKEVESHLSEYKEIDKKIWEYNLKDNVVQSLVKCIKGRQYRSNITELLEECVEPTLKRLGVEDLIPELKEELSESQEQEVLSNNKSWELPTSQKLGIQLSTEKVAKGFDMKKNDPVEKTH